VFWSDATPAPNTSVSHVVTFSAAARTHGTALIGVATASLPVTDPHVADNAAAAVTLN
jgi:hypothetical protein